MAPLSAFTLLPSFVLVLFCHFNLPCLGPWECPIPLFWYSSADVGQLACLLTHWFILQTLPFPSWAVCPSPITLAASHPYGHSHQPCEAGLHGHNSNLNIMNRAIISCLGIPCPSASVAYYTCCPCNPAFCSPSLETFFPLALPSWWLSQ